MDKGIDGKVIYWSEMYVISWLIGYIFFAASRPHKDRALRRSLGLLDLSLKLLSD